MAFDDLGKGLAAVCGQKTTTDASAIICKGCGGEIVGGSALVNNQGWFHNGYCLRAHWAATNYVPRPAAHRS